MSNTLPQQSGLTWVAMAIYYIAMKRNSHYLLGSLGIFMIALLLTFRVQAQSEGAYTVIIKKQEEKKQQRWSLASWFETKEKIKLMDMWLALHSSVSLYEFYLGGDTATVEMGTESAGNLTTESHTVTRGVFAAYASIFGLQGQYTDSSEGSNGYDASFHLRVLGNAVQNTNLTLEYGVRNRRVMASGIAEKFQNQFAGISLTIYLAKVFGIEGLYRSYMSQESDLNTQMVGTRVEGSVFIDYSFLRIFGTWFSEPLTYTTGSIDTVKTSEGVLGGLKLFF